MESSRTHSRNSRKIWHRDFLFRRVSTPFPPQECSSRRSHRANPRTLSGNSQIPCVQRSGAPQMAAAETYTCCKASRFRLNPHPQHVLNDPLAVHRPKSNVSKDTSPLRPYPSSPQKRLDFLRLQERENFLRPSILRQETQYKRGDTTYVFL